MPSRAELVLRADVLGLDPDTYPNDSKLEQKVLYLEKNASTMAGTLATAVLTSDDTDMDAADEITIGDVTYTFVAALSEAKATAELTSDATNVAEGETVTIEGVTYTFRATPVNPYDVDIGSNAATSLDNLKSAINDSGTEGTTYGTGTAAHPLVTATTNTNTVQTIQAKKFGTYAHSFLLAETSGHLSWGAAVMGSGGGNEVAGVDPIPNEVLIGAGHEAGLDNLKVAVNGDTGEGTVYSTGTVAHPQVTATTNTDTAQTFVARDMAVGEDIATVDNDPDHLSFAATTMASGVADQNAVDATAKAQVSGDKNV